jgi:hypothetical protein
MQRLLRDAQDSLEYVYREEPEGLTGDEALAKALEQLLSSLEKWTRPLQERRETAQRTEQIAQRLMEAAAGKVLDLEDEEIRAVLLMLERRQGELGLNIPF